MTPRTDVTPIEKSPPPIKERGRIPTHSEKRIERDRRYSVEAKAFLSEHPICEGELPHICEGVSSEVHHAGGRAASVFFRKSWWRALCGPCHRWVTANPQGAIDRGLSLRRNRVER